MQDMEMSPGDDSDDPVAAETAKMKSFNKFFEKYRGCQVTNEIIDWIENSLGNNLIKYYRKHIMAKILNDKSIYGADEHLKYLEELNKLNRILTKHEIRIYIWLRMNPLKDHKLWFLIENVLSSRLKNYLIRRENERKKKKITYWNIRIQQEWNELSPIIPADDLLTYALTTLRDERKKKYS